MGEEGERHYVLIKDLLLLCMIILYIVEKRHFCRYCLQAFSKKEILQRHIKDCFKINWKQVIIIPRKGEHIMFKSYERKIESPFIIFADFVSISLSKYNGK